jgi:hypothetical protein
MKLHAYPKMITLMTAVPDSSSRRLPVLGSRYLSKPGAMSIKDMIAPPARVKLAHRLESVLSISRLPLLASLSISIFGQSAPASACISRMLSQRHQQKAQANPDIPSRPLQPSRHLLCSTNTSSFAQTNPASPHPSISLKFKALARGNGLLACF